MIIHTDKLKDKVECFEAPSMNELEKQIEDKISDNEAIMLRVHHVSHHVAIDPQSGQRLYTAVVHFRGE
ncbi:DUF2536 family protein [Texcoconibacillus texcoconensis]|uniref:DUF2536 family protein n=1 Tax=Texcoconibacillus texcoconensis TaxID=1095777 RepID=A0A840QRS4_9BACI|nr:DUF2536 family protein [Texcoconibacillus texcoconensis]MBB5174023.1 hypothetical protein [Texcoconibacillus texcoconensis]